MRNQNSLFITFCLSLTAGLLCVFAIFVGYFNGHEQYEMRLGNLEKQVEKERFNYALLNYQLKDFQQTVAQVLPENKKLADNYALKNLASAVRVPASAENLELSASLFEHGKKNFNEAHYDKAIADFQKLTVDFPLSVHNVEAHFFIAESYYLKKDYKSSLSQIDDMVLQFPDNDLTGFILLRMGQISEANNQQEEASEVYKTVMKNFKNETLNKQAQKLAQSLEFK